MPYTMIYVIGVNFNYVQKAWTDEQGYFTVMVSVDPNHLYKVHMYDPITKQVIIAEDIYSFATLQAAANFDIANEKIKR
jgi:hypothetical protein